MKEVPCNGIVKEKSSHGMWLRYNGCHESVTVLIDSLSMKKKTFGIVEKAMPRPLCYSHLPSIFTSNIRHREGYCHREE